jgi:murein DD-endopeptidase MepM/ murein hydrolase activator NlpD
MAMRRAIRPIYDLRDLHVGHVYTIATDTDGRLQRFTYDITDQKRLEITRQHTQFVGKLTSIPYEQQERVISGRITDSIYEALTAQGESPRLVRDLADIFAWKIDFPTDLRQGDEFHLLIEERARQGQLLHYHRILAAELVNQDQVLQAVYYAPQGEYYQPDGRSLRGMFLRSPLQYLRISSHFSRRRLHPILKRYRPHWGIDYAAPRGTPVRTVGDGVVKWAGRKGENGKLITIRHNSVYTSHYLHLSRYARGIRHGVRVKQGQIIGYVGSTGLATGPHLDFRLVKNGRYVNPLTHKSTDAPAIPERSLAAFQRFAAQQLGKLKQAQPNRSHRMASTHGQE